MRRVDVTQEAHRSKAFDTWLILSLLGWLSLIAGAGWLTMPFVGQIGATMDHLQSLGVPAAKLTNVVLACAFLLTLIVPVAAALVPATAWFERLPGRYRKVITGLWATWVAIGIAGLAAALVTRAEGLGFFLVEAAVPLVVGLCAISLLAGAGSAWRRRWRGNGGITTLTERLTSRS